MANRKAEDVEKTPRKSKWSPDFKAKEVAEYLQRPDGMSGADFAKNRGYKVQDIQNWAYMAKKQAGAPMRTWIKKEGKPAKSKPAPSSEVRAGSDGRKIYSPEYRLAMVKRFMEANPKITIKDFAEQNSISVAVVGGWIRKFGTTGSIEREPVAKGKSLTTVDPRQVSLFDPPAAVNHVSQHVTPQMVERMKNEIAKLHDRCTELEEDNAILRGMATVSQRRGYLNLFGIKKGDGK